MGLQRFERRLERLVEGAFGKASRGGIQPVEIGRRMARDMDAGRILGVRGTVVPNSFTISISVEDLERFAGYQAALETELADAAREHAREEGYHFSGPVEVVIVADDTAKKGQLRIRSEIVADPEGPPSTVVLPDGRRVELGEETAIIGRLPECAIALSDPQVSRHHAEIRREERGYRVVDLESTNGIQVNGIRVREAVLNDGDVITVGATSLRYEES
jgi:hypothetical protein